jgi:hypothetical protein
MAERLSGRSATHDNDVVSGKKLCLGSVDDGRAESVHDAVQPACGTLSFTIKNGS